MLEQTQIPKGFMQNAKGDLVHIDNIKPVDKLRDDMVKNMLGKAKMQRNELTIFKHNIMDEISDFVELSLDDYGVKRGGKKGNLSFVSFDGTAQVKFSVAESITFDERLKAAKELIHECISDWSKDANVNIRTLIDQAFQVDKEGNISTGRVLGLRRLDMNDERWDKAMQAISDSVQVTDTKNYIRFYERRKSDDAWTAVSLDIAAL
jgi:Protein of unknown function (DUF3164)